MYLVVKPCSSAAALWKPAPERPRAVVVERQIFGFSISRYAASEATSAVAGHRAARRGEDPQGQDAPRCPRGSAYPHLDGNNGNG
jgi:hypothetical protein